MFVESLPQRRVCVLEKSLFTVLNANRFGFHFLNTKLLRKRFSSCGFYWSGTHFMNMKCLKQEKYVQFKKNKGRWFCLCFVYQTWIKRDFNTTTFTLVLILCVLEICSSTQLMLRDVFWVFFVIVLSVLLTSYWMSFSSLLTLIGCWCCK